MSETSARLSDLGREVRDHFQANKRILSFDQYMQLVEQSPYLHLRGAAQYLRDMFDHFGTVEVDTPAGPMRRFKLFDAPWDDGDDSLIAQEQVQNAIYRVLTNFVRQAKVDRFILLHGPNGSSKSTVTELIARAMEHYSATDEGAVYRFSWIFPRRQPGRGDIGFNPKGDGSEIGDSYALLDEAEIDARVPCELRDHPLLLIPRELRQRLLPQLCERADLAVAGKDDRAAATSKSAVVLCDYLMDGDLSHKSKTIFEALLQSYEGDYLRVLRHIRVERYYLSRRYRVGIARVEPQLAVDARVRQLTADRSLSSLPASLQNVSLYEQVGELVDGNRGIVDYADLLKRPPEAYKYLLTTVESGRVTVEPTNLFVDLVFIGSANENHLNAFMESPEWMSFKARMELIRVPYLRDHVREIEIYRQQLPERQVGKAVAPHALEVAALWGVLTRMHRPDASRFEEPLKTLVARLTPLDKARLFAERRVPDGTSDEEAKTLRAGIADIYGETSSALVYEGRTGASPREVRAVLMNAAEDSAFPCVTAEAVLKHIAMLVRETSVYAFLRQEPQSGGYLDHRAFIDVCRDYYLARADDDVRSSMGLVEEASYAELFSRYVDNVTHFVRNEKMLNTVTGQYDEPDATLMRDVEKNLDVEGDTDAFRQDLMTKIGAWSVDHQGSRPDYPAIFREHFEKLRNSYHQQQRRRVSDMLNDALKVLAEDHSTLTADRVKAVRSMLSRLADDFGYDQFATREVITQLVRRRYSD
ncbi:MAG: serine protein kinase PrkA [Myxococcales bacterium]|nr:serine protein kinase PrkA [Myxococcales bacterium]